MTKTELGRGMMHIWNPSTWVGAGRARVQGQPWLLEPVSEKDQRTREPACHSAAGARTCVLGTQIRECGTSHLCVKQFGEGVTSRDSVKRERVDAQHRGILGLCEWLRTARCGGLSLQFWHSRGSDRQTIYKVGGPRGYRVKLCLEDGRVGG